MENKNFVAIGKIVFETHGYPWNIPHTHFIVNKTDSGLFEATNIQLTLDSIGDSIEEAAKSLAQLTSEYIMEIMLKRRGHDELKELMDSTAMEDYWREFRKIEVDLSRTKRDLSHKFDRIYVAAVKETIEDSIKKAIYDVVKQEAEKVYSAVKGKIPEAVTLYIDYAKAA